MESVFVFSKDYDFKLLGLNKLHPFDGEKFSKAWAVFSSGIEESIFNNWLEPREPVPDELLLKIHIAGYLNSLNHSATIAKVIEVNLARFVPAWYLQKRLLEPIKLGCSGTLMAIEAALENNLIAMNFAGGYHHAFADHGEGFCFFADAALGIKLNRERGRLAATDKVLMIDVDAHRGNGFEATTRDDPYVENFDMYNFQTYPGLHPGEPDDYPCMVPLKAGTNQDAYLNILEKELGPFLQAHADARLVFYNAGNDILDHDPLGGLKVNFDGVVRRDKFVMNELNERKLPTVVMTSGGYSRQSHLLIAELARTIHTLAGSD